MKRILLQDSASRLSLCEGQLIQKEADGSETAHPICAAELVEVYGNAQITTQAVKECLKEGVRINYFSSRGKYLGRLEPGYPKNVRRRMEQYRLYFDGERRLAWCKALLSAKVRGELVELRRQKEQGHSFPYKELCMRLNEGLMELKKANDIDSLLGAEGICAKWYYEMFKYILPEGVKWHGRSYHPAQDGLNELLSCIYGMTARGFREEIEHWSLDPHCGFLHEPRYGGGGLPYDLVEMLRATFCDHLALRLVRVNPRFRAIAMRDGEGHLSDDEYEELSEQVRVSLVKRHNLQRLTALDMQREAVDMTVKSLESEDSVPDYQGMQPAR